jgi:hypothetical protein
VVFRSQSSHFSLELFRDGYGNERIKMKHITVMFVISYIHLYYLLLHLQQCCHSSTAQSLTRSTNISILNNIIKKMGKKSEKLNKRDVTLVSGTVPQNPGCMVTVQCRVPPGSILSSFLLSSYQHYSNNLPPSAS